MSLISPAPGSLLPAGVSLENLERCESDSEIIFDAIQGPAFQRFVTNDSDVDIISSQRSNTSSQSLESFNRFSAKLGSNGADLFSELEDINLDESGESISNAPSELPALKEVQECHAELDEGALFVPTSLIIDNARSKTPSVEYSDSQQGQVVCEVTPTKPIETNDGLDPLTPTANLKVLISAASPEIRNREKQLLQDKAHEDVKEEDLAVPIDSVGKSKRKRKQSVTELDDVDADLEDNIIDVPNPNPGRKEKSLGLLCQRFLSLFPEMPEPGEQFEICLDVVARELAVERRRIYDIVNVLESVEMVSRKAKNKYTWHGKTNICHTLLRLKALAVAEGYPEKLAALVNYESQINNKAKSKAGSPLKKPLKLLNDTFKTGDANIPEHLRKDKSLGIMSQRFLMLFMVSETKTVNLDISAKILIGNPEVDKKEIGKFKTKIRRLYDIANILTSLDLVRKLSITETRERKPAFKYIGPEIDSEDVSHFTSCSTEGLHRPSSKQSLLDCIQNPSVHKILQNEACKNHTPSQSNVPQKKPTIIQIKGQKGSSRRSLSRNSSFEQLCEVTEQLYFESKSTSPTNAQKSVIPPVNKAAKAIKVITVPKENGPRKALKMTCEPPKSVSQSIEQAKPSTSTSSSTNTAPAAVANSIKPTVIMRLTKEELEALKSTFAQQKELMKNDQSGNSAAKTVAAKLVDVLSEAQEKVNQHEEKTKKAMPVVIASALPKMAAPNVNNVQLPTLPAVTSMKPVQQTVPNVSQQPIALNAVKTNVSEQCVIHQATGELKQNIGSVLPAAVQLVPITLDDGQTVLAQLETTMQYPEPVNLSLKRIGTGNIPVAKRIRLDSEVQVDPLPETNFQEIQPKLKYSPPSQLLQLSPPFSANYVPDLCHGLVSPFPHEIVNVIPPVKSELNTPTLPELCMTPQGSSLYKPGLSVFEFPPSTCTAGMRSLQTETRSLPVTPTYCGSGSNSPLMLLPARPATSPPPEISTSHVARPSIHHVPRPQPLRLTQHHNCKQISGKFGSSGISPLVSLTPNFTQFPSPVTTAAFSTYDITPTTTRPRVNIHPSNNNIINLMPLFSDGGGEKHDCGSHFTPPAQQPSPQLILQKPFLLPAGYSLPPQLATPSAKTGTGYITPKSHVMDCGILAPHDNNVTPSHISTKPLATPGSFFRSTPGGFVPMTSMPPSSLIVNSNSAFQCVAPTQDGNVSTARKLSLM